MGTFRILVIDDDHLVGWALRRALTSLPVTVDVAATAREALDHFQAGSFDMAFLDIHLPDTNGLDLLPQLRHVSPSTRVVVISSDSTPANRRRAVEGGAWQFLEKPFELNDITRILTSLGGTFPAPRRHERFLSRMELRFHLLDPEPGETGMEWRYLDATSLDVGHGGLRLTTPFPLKPGQRVVLGPTAGDDPFVHLVRADTPARVVWVADHPSGWAAGLCYELTPGRTS